MSRLAFFSPLPPSPTGIADYSADVLTLLAARHQIDVFFDQETVDSSRLPSSVRLQEARAFPHGQERPYDLAIYQLGNGPAHDFIYPHLLATPGLLVLHDLVLHHARARIYLDSPEARAYASDPSSGALRAAALVPLQAYSDELERSYPGRGARVAEAHLATSGKLLPYAYPLFRVPVEASRFVLVHNAYMERAIREEVAAARVRIVPMPVKPLEAPPDTVAALRAELGIKENDFVVGTFGLLTEEKQIATVARAVARAAVSVPRIRLLLVGEAPDPRWLAALLAEHGVRDRTIAAGRVPMEKLGSYLALTDVVLNLRYPTARETSAALLRVLAQGRPTVISDLENLSDIPEDCVLRADLTDEEGDVTRALLRLAERPDLRARLGSRAADFIKKEHEPAKTLEAYDSGIATALAS